MRRHARATLFPYTTLFRSNAKNLGGQVEEEFGRATGDVKGQLQGNAKRVEGALQDAYGQAMETAADAAEVMRKSASRSEEHTSELQSRGHLVCRLLLEKKK